MTSIEAGMLYSHGPFVIMVPLQVYWSPRRERWSLGREGSCSLSMMSMKKLGGEHRNHVDILGLSW